MGQTNTKVYTVTSDAKAKKNTFQNLQDAINCSTPGSTIMINGGEHKLHSLISSLHIVGLNGAKIIPMIGKKCNDTCDVTFENIIFKNDCNNPIIFKNCQGYIFRNCEFYITLAETNKPRTFGFQLIGSSALLQNPIFCMTIEKIDKFIAIGAGHNSGYISLQSPIIRINYSDVGELNTFFFRGANDKCLTSYIEVFSSSIHLRPNSNRISTVKFWLFRGIGEVNSSIIGSKIYLAGTSNGKFNFATGDVPIYINGLTVTATCPTKWKICKGKNTFISSFLSNINCANDIVDIKSRGNNCDCECPLPIPLPEVLPCASYALE